MAADRRACRQAALGSFSEGESMVNRFVLILSVVAPLWLAGCSNEPLVAGPQTASLDPIPTSAPYALGPGDQIDVVVFGEDNLSGTYDLDDSGSFSLPLAGPVT